MQQTAGSPQLIPASSLKRWLRKSQELKQKLLVGAENGRPTKPWHGKQNGIAQNLCRGRSVWGGKWGLQKVSGMGGKEERTILLLQGQDFWGMEGGGRSHTPSFTLVHTRSLSNMQRLWSSVRSSQCRANRAGRLWSQLLNVSLNCNAGYTPVVFSYLKTEEIGHIPFKLNPGFGSRNVLKWLPETPFSHTSVGH